MFDIIVNPDILRAKAKELKNAAGRLGHIQGELSSLIGSIDASAYEGKLMKMVADILSSSESETKRLSNEIDRLQVDLTKKANAFEEANKVVSNTFHTIKLLLLNRSMHSIIASSAFWIGLSAILAKDAKSIMSIGSQEKLEENVTPIIKEPRRYPKKSGTKDLHDYDNARDYISSDDPGQTPNNKKRVYVTGREVKASHKGTINFISFNDGSTATEGNEDGITMKVTYENGYTVKYSHLIPNEKLLKAAGIEEDLSITEKRVYTKHLGELKNVEAGEVIGSYNQIGDSSNPHLHINVWKDGEPIDPDKTDIPKKTLK